LLDKRAETDKEKQNLERTKLQRIKQQKTLEDQLKTIQASTRGNASAADSSDSLVKWLKNLQDEMTVRFQNVRKMSHVQAQMRFEDDEKYLQRIETATKDIERDGHGGAHTKHICGIMRGLVSVRRMWLRMQASSLQEEDLDLSYFFEGAPSDARNESALPSVQSNQSSQLVMV